ncbi:unnamed protein product [Ostreobium quekettii]|uniref:SAP domain-containing protein n=1 Tax=Ostreobium quekettii TaxID=121088 RepID=A0A8S1JFH2_9CHLO|nr:unnamed protein product [Ostreobium quekettii]|eukprot:evm.model.scf_962.4 EVM.evm.TU.scf_962.4   scf_962:31138-36318(+)
MAAKLDLKKLRVPELREELASRGMDTTGTKSVLMERLERSLDADAAQKAAATSGMAPALVVDDTNEPLADVLAAGGPGMPAGQQQRKRLLMRAKKAPAAGKAGGVKAGEGEREKENGADGDADNGKSQAASLAGAADGPSGSSFGSKAKHQAIVFNGASAVDVKLVPNVKAPVVETVEESSEAEKRKERAKRFGIFDSSLEADKKKARAARFGIPTQELEEEKKKERAKRFGIPTPELEEEKKKVRAKRFGIVTKEDEEEKKRSRAKRFGIVTAEGEREKKKARAARFGLSAPTTGLSETEKLKKRAQRFAS